MGKQWMEQQNQQKLQLQTAKCGATTLGATKLDRELEMETHKLAVVWQTNPQSKCIHSLAITIKLLLAVHRPLDFLPAPLFAHLWMPFNLFALLLLLPTTATSHQQPATCNSNSNSYGNHKQLRAVDFNISVFGLLQSPLRSNSLK